ncbi:MAG: beta-galactosidase [Candidatus Omnitrophota bacterium]
MKNKGIIKKGVFYLDGKPLFLLSSDYPYYRDRPDNWQDRLLKLKEAGIDIITAYIPWRHHAFKKQGRISYDFAGRTQDNRNLLKFIELTAKTGLYLILKPGPFIHAEVNFGGLPDWVCPEEDKTIQPAIDFDKRSYTWLGKALPSPLDEKFLKLVQEWFSYLDKKIFSKIAYPAGNLIGLQIGNEGIYSNAPAPILCSDYSKPSLKLYCKFLKKKYPQIENDSFPVSADKNELLAFADFQSFYYETVLKKWLKAFSVKVPLMVNLNPPQKGEEDAWLSRNVPERLAKLNIAYGYTDWIGIPRDDEEVRNRYFVFTKRAPGFNLEDNWGFSKLYDKKYECAETPFYQSLFTIACGAKGFNVYTGVSTAHWDAGLDNQHEIPYPATAPIDEKGVTARKYEALKKIGSFFKKHEKDFLESRPYVPFAWGLYLPYARVSSQAKTKDDFAKIDMRKIRCAQAFTEFASGVYKKNLDFEIVTLDFADKKMLASKKVIVLEGGFFMDGRVQEKLAEYVLGGGNLVMTGEIPCLNEQFGKSDILMKGFKSQGKGKFVLVREPARLMQTLLKEYKPDEKIVCRDKGVRFFLYEHPAKNTQFVFIFNEGVEREKVEFKVLSNKINLDLAGNRACLMKISDNGAEDVLSVIGGVKGAFNNKPFTSPMA